MEWLKKTLFGRQLSHGTDVEHPESFEEAIQQQMPSADVDDTLVSPGNVPYMSGVQQEQVEGAADFGVSSPSPGGEEMRTAYAVSNKLVRDRMEADDVKVLDSVKDTDIVCVRGTYDHIHLVLEAIGVPFSHINPSTLLSMELKPEQTVYVNCPSSFPREAALKLRDFVTAGGQLITTDWALLHVVEVAFPNTIKFSGNSTGDEVVAVEIVDKEDEVLKGFIDQEKDASPVWWLEGSSYPIKILDKKRVKVLVRSDELKKRYKHDPVIVSFEYGEGIVYHMISHFYLQRSETRTQKQGMSSKAYAETQGASKSTMDLFNDMESKTPGINYGMVQSAATSSEFVSRCLVRQKKKFTSKS